jgi:hypothetical protein
MQQGKNAVLAQAISFALKLLADTDPTRDGEDGIALDETEQEDRVTNWIAKTWRGQVMAPLLTSALVEDLDGLPDRPRRKGFFETNELGPIRRDPKVRALAGDVDLASGLGNDRVEVLSGTCPDDDSVSASERNSQTGAQPNIQPPITATVVALKPTAASATS